MPFRAGVQHGEIQASPRLLPLALAAAAARLAGAGVAWGCGFRAVSDDDFARVVIAQRFAAAPRLDPSGTSWLPLPFWLVGTSMRVLGSSLFVARAVAVVGAVLGGALVAAVAVASGLKPRRALAASLVAAAMPWGMQLAVSTVPEAPAAACAAAGAIALASDRARVRLLGGVALWASAWSRYDAWPMAIAFAACTLVDARSAASTSHDGRRRTFVLAAAAAFALAGPTLWSAWEWASYGDPLRYLRLVRSYRQALGPGPSLAHRISGYPAGIVEEMREVLGAAIVGAVAAVIVARKTRVTTGEVRFATSPFGVRWSRPLVLAGLQLLILVIGDIRDGAPTHHPERALLGPATVVLFAASDGTGALLALITRRAVRWTLIALAAVALTAWISLRMVRSLRWYAAAPRTRETVAGESLSRAAPHGRVLLDTRDLPAGSLDYGYYAVLAAFGRPLDGVVDRDQDPRRARARSSFEEPESLRARVTESGADVVLAWGERSRATAIGLGGRVVDEEPRIDPGNATEPARWSVIRLEGSL